MTITILNTNGHAFFPGITNVAIKQSAQLRYRYDTTNANTQFSRHTVPITGLSSSGKPLDGDMPIAIPSLFRASQQNAILFHNLSDYSKISIYSVDGRLLFTQVLQDTNSFVWDVKSSKSQPIGSGVYTAVLYKRGSSEIIKRKVVIVR